jgi:hypothetical protein
MKSKSAALFVVSSLFLCGCGGGPRPAASSKEEPAAPVAATPTPAAETRAETTVEEFFLKGQLWPGSDAAKFLKAWRREPGRERYRLVRPDDFVTPAGEKRRRWPGIGTPDGEQVMWGTFDGNYGHNLVVVVADRTKESPERFGVVLFKERDAGYDVRWIYRDADFSHGLTVGRHSGDIYLTKFGPEGSDKSCDIEWSRAGRRFVCRDL